MATILSFLLLISLMLAIFFTSNSNASITQFPRRKSVHANATPNGSNFTYVCDPSRASKLGLDISSFVFCDTSLPYQVRAKDLVDRMTLSEKVQQLGNKASGVSRLGLPAYNWWSEALHGVSNVGPGTVFDNLVPSATSFPTVILTTASFNITLWKTIGQAVSTEARAMYNLGRAGLTFWSPTINVVRDPRWGRITETPGEDPFIVGTYASTYVRGLQDVEGTENYKDLNSRPLKVSSCCKHYVAYDVDHWNGVDRLSFDARVTEQDMVETFARPFEMCAKDGDVSSIMCSYNQVNGIPTCADPKLLNQTIRGEWNLHGYIVSDCDSVQVMVDNQKYLNDTAEDAVAQTLKAGLNLDCGDFYPNYSVNAVQQGKVREGEIDKSLNYLYVVLMRLGYFDGRPKYKDLGKKDICSSENIELATEAAREGIVLLKNDNGTLPLSTAKFKSLAVIGPHANATLAMIANYAFEPWKAGNPCQYTTPINGFSTYVNVRYAAGCGNVKCENENLISPAIETAKSADATIILAGLDLSIEAEGWDRTDLYLPGYQTDLINQVANVSKGPVILVIMSAGGVDISFATKNSQIKSILWAGYPGEEGGRAIADVVFGQYNPGGRLPITWYEGNYVNQLPMTSMPLRPVGNYPGRTYKFFNGSTVFPFGYGLSYTQFKYQLLSPRNSVSIKRNKFTQCRDLSYNGSNKKPDCPALLIDDLNCKYQFRVEILVKNVGNRDGSEVVLVYSKPPDGILDTYLKQVIGFQRVFVAAGKSQKVSFVFNTCKSLGIVDYAANNLLPSGAHGIIVGDSKLVFPVQVNFG